MISSEEILAAKAGDPEAVAELMKKAEPIAERLRMRLRGATRNRERIDWAGLHQDVMLQVLRLLPRFRGTHGGQLVAWLQRIVNSRHQDGLRRTGQSLSNHKQVLRLDGVLNVLDLRATSPTPLDEAIAEESRAIVTTALAGLRTPMRSVLELRVIEKRAFADVARELDLLTANAAECLFRRALTRLEKALARLGTANDA